MRSSHHHTGGFSLLPLWHILRYLVFIEMRVHEMLRHGKWNCPRKCGRLRKSRPFVIETLTVEHDSVYLDLDEKLPGVFLEFMQNSYDSW